MPKQTKSIEQLRHELEAREAELLDLQKKRATVENVLNDIDRQIAALTGKAIGERRGRMPGKAVKAVTKGEKSPYTGKAVRALRKKLNLSQEKFATLVGTSPMTVYLWEKRIGGLKLRGATQAKLAKVWNAKPQAASKPAEKKTEKAKKSSKPTKRAKNVKPLAEYVADVLKGKKDGMKVNGIIEAVKKAGYQTTNKSFYNVVSGLTNKDKRFVKISPGLFKLA